MGRLDDVDWTPEDLTRVLDDMAEFGFSPEAIAQTRADHQAKVVDQVFEVMAENAVAVRLFLTLATQWRNAPLSAMGGTPWMRTGLDYAAVEPTARLAGLVVDTDAFSRLQMLEAHALSAWSQERQARR